MGKNYWMFAEDGQNAAITRQIGYSLFGMGPRYKKRAERMRPNDRAIFYSKKLRSWTASATITSNFYVDESIVWKPEVKAKEFKYRVKLKPDYILGEDQYLDGLQVGPSLEYVKRWAPEDWPLAFFDRLHLLPQRDFSFLEGEMRRLKTGSSGNSRGRTRSKPKAKYRRKPHISKAKQNNRPSNNQ